MNRIDGLADMIAGRVTPPYTLGNRVGDSGEINCEGDADTPIAYVFAPQDTRFWSNIEPGVVELVRMLTTDLGWLTYSSCEGHDGPPFRERHVGLVARNPDEGARIVRVLGGACARVGQDDGTIRLRLDLVRAETDLGPWPCLDLTFAAMKTAGDYQEGADALQYALIRELRPQADQAIAD